MRLFTKKIEPKALAIRKAATVLAAYERDVTGASA
jgi:hypothetical protein